MRVRNNEHCHTLAAPEGAAGVLLFKAVFTVDLKLAENKTGYWTKLVPRRRRPRGRPAEIRSLEARNGRKKKKEKKMQKQKVRIRLQAYDYRVLDQAVGGIIDTARGTGAHVVGPVPLPTRVERFTVNRSVNVDKKSMDQFEMRTHKRLLDIVNPTAKTIDELKKLSLPSGVDITIRV